MKRARDPVDATVDADAVRDAACVVRAMSACSSRLPAMEILRLVAWKLKLELPRVLRARDEAALLDAGLIPRYARDLLACFPDDAAVDLLDAAVDLLQQRLPSRLTGPALKAWGTEAPDRVRRDAYRCVRHLRGALADADAMTDPAARVAGHAAWHLDDAKSRGHTAVRTDSLVRAVAAALGTDTMEVRLDLAACRDDGRVRVVSPGQPDELIADPEAWRQESQLAKAIRDRAARRELDVAAVVAGLRGLTPEQTRAAEKVCGAAVAVLTGGPGSGKTTVVRALVEAVGEDRCLLTAPTGRAARNLGGRTVHRASGGRLARRPLQETTRADVPDDLALMVVDEASMLSTELAVGAFALAPPGCHVLLVGDADQLPPIGAGDVFGDVIASGVCPVATLTHNHRCDDGVQAIARAVAEGRADDVPLVDVGTDKERMAEVVRRACRDDAAVLVYTNATRTLANRAIQSAKRPVKVMTSCVGWGIPPNTPAVVRTDPATAASTITFPTGVHQDARMDVHSAVTFGRPPSGDETLGVGDQVMVTKNQNKKRVGRGETSACNGDVGTLAVAGGLLGKYVVRFEDGTTSEFPKADGWLTLGYAATVHKFQGSECDAVVVPLDTMWDRQLLYTAVTRARSHVAILGTRSALRVVLSRRKTDRVTCLRALLRDPTTA